MHIKHTEKTVNMVFEVVMRNVTDMTGVDIQRGEEHSQIIDMLKMRL
jgi:hypothetical protein